MTPNETLTLFKSSKFLIADRTAGKIYPGSMRIIGFDEVLNSGHFRVFSYESQGKTLRYCHFSWGFYLLNEDGTFQNVNRKLKKMLMTGVIECDAEGFPKKLQAKENV